MPRFYLPPDQCQGNRLTLAQAEAAHATRVLRLAPGAQVTVLDGRGGLFDCAILATTPQTVELEVIRSQSIPAPRPPIILIQSVLKAKGMDWLIQKATELGVTRIVPVLAERSVPDFTRAEARRKRAKWELIAIEALKQCGLPWLPCIESPVPLSDFLAHQAAPPCSLLAALDPDTRPLRDVLDELLPTLPSHEEIGVWLGPEGDFSPAELAAIAATRAQPVSLGPRVLRSETAALALLAALNCQWRR